MFNKKENYTNGKMNEMNSGSVNLVGAGTFIEGTISAEGDVRIDGEVNGNVKSKGKVVVGSGGKVEGEILCKNADISGTVNAKVSVEELLSLKSSAKLDGEIITGKLSVEPGANFTGSCSMGAVIKDFSNNSDNKEKKKEELKTKTLAV